jgi:hypothetical protein
MPAPWGEIAHTAFDDANNQPITADATYVAKFGAPAVAIVTALLTALLGASWNLDPQTPAVLFAGAIIVAAVVLGVYVAFASDIHTRGAVTVARFQAVEILAEHEAARQAAAAADKQLLATTAAAKAASDNQLAETKRELDRTKAELSVLHSSHATTEATLQNLSEVLVKKDTEAPTAPGIKEETTGLAAIPFS